MQHAPDHLDHAASSLHDAEEWHYLPPRGAKLAALGAAIGLAIPGGLAPGVLALMTNLGSSWVVAPAAALIGAAIGALVGARLGYKRHRRTVWRLDEDGFAVQRGRWWRIESRIPISRVQHLDLKRGPLERAMGLATLVIHTAGTRMAAVSVTGLDDADAEHLRDRLARQLDSDDDAL